MRPDPDEDGKLVSDLASPCALDGVVGAKCAVTVFLLATVTVSVTVTVDSGNNLAADARAWLSTPCSLSCSSLSEAPGLLMVPTSGASVVEAAASEPIPHDNAIGIACEGGWLNLYQSAQPSKPGRSVMASTT